MSPCPRGAVTFWSRRAATRRRTSAARWTASPRNPFPRRSWIVVDDGSTDETPAILAEYAARLPYLTVVRRDDRGRRSVGPGVVEAFYAGLERVDLGRFDYLCKLDMDLDLPPRYFEGLMRADGGRAAARDDLRQAVVRASPELASWSRRCAATRCRWG